MWEPRAEQPCQCRECHDFTATQSIATNSGTDSIGHCELQTTNLPNFTDRHEKKFRRFAPDGYPPTFKFVRRHWPQIRFHIRPTNSGFSKLALVKSKLHSTVAGQQRLIKLCCWHQWRKIFIWSLMTLSLLLVSRPNRIGE